MTTITSSEQLLARPVHQRQTLVVVPDEELRGLDQLVSTEENELLPAGPSGSTDQSEKWLDLAISLGATVGASRIVGAAADRARHLVKVGASRAMTSRQPLVPLAVGAVAVGAFAALLDGRADAPVDVIFVSASAAQALTFSDGPFEIGRVYTAHPMHHDRYLPAERFSRLILEERNRETHTFLVTCCGASKVDMTIDHGDNLSVVVNAGYEEGKKTSSGKLDAKQDQTANRHAISEAPGRPSPGPLVPSDWAWFAAEPEWQVIHRQRRDAGITRYTLTTVIKDDRTVDFKALAKLPGVKLNADLVVKRNAKTVVTWKVSFPPLDGPREAWAKRPDDYIAVEPIVRGRYNSSLTRVRPFFAPHLAADPTGARWLPQLLSATSAGAALLAQLSGDPGTLHPSCATPRPYDDKILGRTVQLATACEFPIAPSEAFLRWAIDNPNRLTWPGAPGQVKVYGDSTQRWRSALFGPDPAARAEAQQEAHTQLDAVGAAGSKRKWWAFEGFTEVDCCLQTDRLVLLVEGKRTEPLSGSTDWLPARSQLVRNLEVAGALAGDRAAAVLLITETPIDNVLDNELIAVGAPWLDDSARAAVADRFLGQVTWSAACDATGLNFANLPDERPGLEILGDPPTRPGPQARDPLRCT